MRVGLGIPFLGRNTHRVRAFNYTYPILKDLYDWDIVTDSFKINLDGSFNRGATRNHLVDLLRGMDVVVLCDADSWPERGPLATAVYRAYDQGGFWFPHDTVWQLGPDRNFDYAYGPSAGGCWVFRPQEWFDIGGMEQRGGWSVDDRTFLVQINTLSTKNFVPGKLTCLWHPPDDRKITPESQRIINRYLTLEGNPIGLRKYLNTLPQKDGQR